MNKIKPSYSVVSKLLRYDNGKIFWKKQPKRGFDLSKEAGCFGKKGYRQVMINYRAFKTHNIVWLLCTKKWPKHYIDHINRKILDNRFENLREVTNSENCKNKGMYSTNTSGFTGVYFIKNRKKWRASIIVEGKFICLGQYSHIKEAIKVRAEANQKYGFHKSHGLPTR